MSMSPCRDCGEPVSRQAKACPKCGAPVRTTIRTIATVIKAAATLLVLSVVAITAWLIGSAIR